GTVRAGPGFVRMGGNLVAGELATLISEGGRIELLGTLDLEGTTLNLDEDTGDLWLVGGALLNGRVSQADGARLRFTSSNNVLDDIEVVGDLDVTESTGRVRGRNGLALVNGRVRLNNSGGIGFEGSQTFAGEIEFEGVSDSLGIEGSSVLTLAPTALVHGRGGRIGPAIFVGGAGVLVNRGTIRAEGAAATITVNPDRKSTRLNSSHVKI